MIEPDFNLWYPQKYQFSSHSMSFAMLQRTRWALACVLFATTTTASGCGLFSDDPDDDPLDVEYNQAVPAEFAIDDDQLCPPTEDCTVEPMPSPTDIDLPAVEPPPVFIDVIELTGNEELGAAAGRLKRVEIESIDWEVKDPNTLNIPSPPLEIYIAPETATDREAQSAAFVGTLPSVGPMTVDSGTIQIEQADQDKASELFKALKFNVIAYGDKDIAEGELFPAQGRVEYILTFNLRFTANAIEQF